MSRGLEKKHVIHELLIEIFKHESRIGLGNKFHKLTAKERKELDTIVQPHFETILKTLDLT